MGAATAAALARRGGSVLLLEQFSLGHERGSSHGASRIFRLSYPDPVYVEMAQEALSLWRRIEERSGLALLNITGGLDIGEGIESNAHALEMCGAAHESGTGTEVMSRFPYLRFDPHVPVLFSPDSGTIAAERATATFVDIAKTEGATVREGVRVVELEPSEAGVTVRTKDRDIVTGIAVVTAGAWAKPLLSTAGIDLPVWVTRETVAYFDLDPMPPTLVDWRDPLVYALPNAGGELKAAQHIAGPRVEPDEPGPPDEDSVAAISKWVAAHYPSAHPEPHLRETCLYTNTDDQNFILERRGNIVIGSPCSGHGFKFAPLIGERLAALALRT